MKDETTPAGVRRRYLQSRLLLIVLVVAVPLVALLSLSIVDARRDAEQQAFLSLRQRAGQVAQRMDTMLDKTEHLLVFMSTRHRIALLNHEACESWVSGAPDVGIYYTNIGLIDATGNLVCSSRPAKGRTQFASFDWFRAGLAAPGIRLSDPLRGPLSGRMVEYMTLPVHDDTGATVGLLAASIDLEALNRSLEPLVAQSGVTVAVHKGGVFVTRLPDPLRWMGQPVPDRLRWLNGEAAGPQVGVGIDGVLRAFAPVSLARPGFLAIASMPRDQVYRQVDQDAWRRIAVAAAIVLCALLVASVMARRLARALQSIADTARHLHDGATHVRADARLPGEFGEVAVEFNRLMDRNDQRAAELRQSERRAIRLGAFHETLSATGQAIARQASAGELLDAACRACTQSGLAGGARICREDPQGWRTLAVSGTEDREAPLQAAETRLLADAVARGDCATGLADDGAPAAAVPFALEGDVAGVLFLRAHDGEPIDGELGALLVALAREISFGLDLDRHREARVALAAAQAESQAKTAFLSHVSHELRTPLTAVLGFAQLVQADAIRRGDHADRERLGHVLGAGRQLMALIDDLMDVARIEGGVLRLEMVDVDVADILTSVMHLNQPLADARRVALQLDVGEVPGLTIRTDPVRLRQVFTNLVSNGVKYNRPGGWVRVSASSDDAVVQLFVKDDGIGMTSAQQRGLFQAFNRLGREHSDVQGTGIGLLITKGLIELLGGALAFESERDVGTTVTVTLPIGTLVGAPAADAGAESASVSLIDRDVAGLVLYIEDNEVNALLVEQVLAPLSGVRVVVARNAREGLRLATQLRPHLVLMDMQLPDADGLEILAGLRADPATASLRVIALSSSADPQEVAAALRAGAQAYWTKPIDFDQLRTGVASVVREEALRRSAAAGGSPPARVA